MARQSSTTRRLPRLLALAVCALALVGLISLSLGGCGKAIDTVYGQRTGTSWASVNGTGVLAEMFELAGHTVFSWRMLSPRLRRRADCIVWFPDDFHPPSPAACQWLEGWLREAPGRTLIYVGRDFDAAGWYWQKIRPRAPPGQKREIARRQVEAKTDFLGNLRSITTAESCDWFTIQGKRGYRKVRSLEGHPHWVEGIDPTKLEIELNHRLVPSDDAEVLLESEGDVLVSTRQFHRSRLIVVANGSFLLNLPLVGHEHRKLAARLIAEVGRPRQTVVFLESGPGGPLIPERDPAMRPPSGLEILRIWPANWILLHLVAAGIILCFSRFPIFGEPRELEPEGTSDFGRHIQALGELLERSGDAASAAARLAHYRQLARSDSAACAGGRQRGRPNAKAMAQRSSGPRNLSR